MNKQITSLEFCLENCEGILVGKDSIKHFSNENNEISLLLENYGDCSYTTTWSENKTHPLIRLVEYQDIVSIRITYDDNSTEEIEPEWYYESEYYTPQNNKYQINEMIDWKTISIAISKKLYINKRIKDLNNIILQAKEELNSLEYEILTSDKINKDLGTLDNITEYDNITFNE